MREREEGEDTEQCRSDGEKEREHGASSVTNAGEVKLEGGHLRQQKGALSALVFVLAEAGGVELPRPFRVCRLSKAVH